MADCIQPVSVWHDKNKFSLCILALNCDIGERVDLLRVSKQRSKTYLPFLPNVLGRVWDKSLHWIVS